MHQRPEPIGAHLSGLLDLQNALYDLDQVADAFQEWSGDPGLSPLDVLTSKGEASSRQRELMEGLAGLLMERHSSDRSESSWPIDGNAAAPEIKAKVPCDGLPSDLDQRFRIVRHHAEGGLGTVSVAIDLELNREVALKQILERHADSKPRRARFLTEAEITGGLEHPGIIPVYSLGHSSGGRPFYAMRFIRGETLADAIDRFHRDETRQSRDPGAWSLGLHKLLRRFVDVCNAIAYAHGRGIVHRDLKPSNVMVGKHGETLVVDWGLAKSLNSSSSADSEEGLLLPTSGLNVTLPGSAVGTPSFMSPEQAAGSTESIGLTSDIYSLGATLYCLLTGRPAFDSEDPLMTIQQVQVGEFPTPRRANSLVPRPLEAVCLKAMARRPEARYQSARALADDIERWMADEPVSADRERLGDRARRWARRKRSTVSVLLAGFLVALVGFAVVLVVQARGNDQLLQANEQMKQFNLILKDSYQRESRANGDLRAANERVAAANRELQNANDRERSRFDLALEAIRLFHSEVSNDVLLKEGEFSGLKKNLLKGATEFYRKIEHQLQAQSDPSSRTSIARVYGQIADLESTFGTPTDAQNAWLVALKVRKSLVTESPDDLSLQADLASCLISMGVLKRSYFPPNQAIEPLEEARQILEKIVGLDPTNKNFQILLANDHHQIGLARLQAEANREAIAAFDRSLRVREPLAFADGSSVTLWKDLASTFYLRGIVLFRSGRGTESVESYFRARKIFEDILASDPSNFRLQFDLSCVHKDLSDVLFRIGRLDDAIVQGDQGRKIRESLSLALPGSIGYRTALSHSLLGLGRMFVIKGQRSNGIAFLRRSALLQESLPVTPINLYNLAETCGVLSAITESSEAADEASRAAQALRRAVDKGFRDFEAVRSLGKRYPLIQVAREFQGLLSDLNFPADPFRR